MNKGFMQPGSVGHTLDTQLRKLEQERESKAKRKLAVRGAYISLACVGAFVYNAIANYEPQAQVQPREEIRYTVTPEYIEGYGSNCYARIDFHKR